MTNLEIVVLAAGKGTRMKSTIPKVLQTVGGSPILEHILNTCEALGAHKTHVVVGHQADQVEKTIVESTRHRPAFCLQSEQKGTGHAVMQALPGCGSESRILILNGDIPLIAADSLQKLLQLNDDFSLMTCCVSDPFGLGRVVRDGHGKVIRVVEEKDASVEEKEITEINTNFMVANCSDLKRWLSDLNTDNQQGEYYLTDVIERAVEQYGGIGTSQPANEEEILGVNSQLELARLERLFQRKTIEDLMHRGLRVADPDRVDIRGHVTFGSDCFVDVNCVLEGNIILGDRCTIRPGCILTNVNLGNDCVIDSHSVLEQAVVGERCNIGPFARIRPETVLSDDVRIGNFVEIKKTAMSKGSKANHLSYVGDSTVGQDVNIGAGVITCNYDGANKHATLIGDRVFVGSNSQLVAPVNIGSGATVGAGSTITANVPDNALAISRGKQRHIENWQRPTKSKC
ncbi:MAG: bifunctional UDP-N-acetylglucosamine diphosphorylase/glucosamine-1-phosphate N-acetyltransferase GlmU [Pseudomonadota bacterium]